MATSDTGERHKAMLLRMVPREQQAGGVQKAESRTTSNLLNQNWGGARDSDTHSSLRTTEIRDGTTRGAEML